MDRPYGTYSSTSTTTRNAGTTGTARRTGGYREIETDYPDDDVHDYDMYDSLGEPDGADAHDDGYDEYGDVYEYEDPIDRRWIWVAGVAGAILLVAIVCTVVILGGGDSGSVSKTVAPPIPTTAPSAVPTTTPPVMTSAAPPPAPAPIAPLSPETVTTVAPSQTAVAPPAPAPAAAPTDNAPAVSPRTITYQVTGSRPLLDMVTVVYTDAQGALQTEFNVALPWSRSVTLDPGVELKSVIATSLTGQLNCSVTDSSGTPLVVQNNNAMIATCTR
jgi:MmpS family membrane protein